MALVCQTNAAASGKLDVSDKPNGGLRSLQVVGAETSEPTSVPTATAARDHTAKNGVRGTTPANKYHSRG